MNEYCAADGVALDRRDFEVLVVGMRAAATGAKAVDAHGMWRGELHVTSGTPQQITDHEKADVLPVFSPDGKQLMWTSSRTADGSSQLWIADWTE